MMDLLALAKNVATRVEADASRAAVRWGWSILIPLTIRGVRTMAPDQSGSK